MRNDNRFLRIYFGALSDLEVELSDFSTLECIRQYLFSDDKRLAQAAASCLISCFKNGKEMVRITLELDLPHKKLIEGILKLNGD